MRINRGMYEDKEMVEFDIRKWRKLRDKVKDAKVLEEVVVEFDGKILEVAYCQQLIKHLKVQFSVEFQKQGKTEKEALVMVDEAALFDFIEESVADDDNLGRN